MGRRKSTSSEYPKVTRSICFVGEDGYKILSFYDEEGKKYEYGKSGLVIDLLKLYKEAIEVYGKECIMLKLRMILERDKNNMERED